MARDCHCSSVWLSKKPRDSRRYRLSFPGSYQIHKLALAVTQVPGQAFVFAGGSTGQAGHRCGR